MEKTRVMFIQPPFPVNGRHSAVFPTSSASIAGFLRKNNKNVELSAFDAHITNTGEKEILKQVRENNPEIVGIGYWTCQAPFVYGLSKKIREMDGNALIVHGGIHASFVPEEALHWCDVAVIGEGEKTFAEIVAARQKRTGLEEIRGIAFNNGKGIIRTAEAPLIENLDEIPFPAFDIFDMQRYVESSKLRELHVVGGKRMPVLASRGCPYNCSFCLSPKMWRRKVRWRSAESVLNDIKKFNSMFGFTRFQFYDDNFLLNRNFVEQLCNGIALLGFEAKWVALSRAAHVIENRDLLPMIKKAGCVGIEMGLETADNAVLKKIGKCQETGLVDCAIRLQQKAGLKPLYTIMAFNPGETISSIRKLRAYIEEKMPESAKYKFFGTLPFVSIGQFATPYPGTGFFENRLEEGTVIEENWDNFFHHQINFLPKSLLQDIPAKAKPLSAKTVSQCVKAAQCSLFKYFPLGKGREKACEEMALATKTFYELCDGKASIGEIAEKMAVQTGLAREKSLRFAALATIVLAQTQIIEPAASWQKNHSIQ